MGCAAHWSGVYPLVRRTQAQMRQDQLLAGQAPGNIWGRRQHLVFNLRHNLLFIAVPVGLIVLLVDVLSLASARLDGAVHGWLALAGMVGAGAIFLSAPVMIVRVWRTEPLADDVSATACES